MEITFPDHIKTDRGRDALMRNIHHVKLLFHKHGVVALSCKWMRDNGYKTLYHSVVGHGKITLEHLSLHWGVHEEWCQQRKRVSAESRGHVPWSDKIIKDEVRKLVDLFGYLPSAQYLRDNGYTSLVSAIYKSGNSYIDLRKEIDQSHDPKFWSRNGMYWRSLAETNMANFLYSRDVAFKQGERYPREFEEKYGVKGVYDMHFQAVDGRWIDVEIWGDNPGGRSKDRYACQRTRKEEFNKDRPFLGIWFKDCYDEERLGKILCTYIRSSQVVNVHSEADRKIKAVNWSRMEEVMHNCRIIISIKGYLPPEDWLRKRGKFANRPVEDWEVDLPFNMGSLTVHIKTVGGMRLVRDLLGDTHTSTIKWDRTKALEELKDIYSTYGVQPYALKVRLEQERGKDQNLVNRITRVLSACMKHFQGGYREACSLAGIVLRQAARSKY